MLIQLYIEYERRGLLDLVDFGELLLHCIRDISKQNRSFCIIKTV